MQEKLSDYLITISTMMMLAQDRGEMIKLAGKLNEAVLQAMELERTQNCLLPTKKEKKSSALLNFTEQEIERMPTTFKKDFIASGSVARVIKYDCGEDRYEYEILYCRNGYCIEVKHDDLATAKKLFVDSAIELYSPALPDSAEPYYGSNGNLGELSTEELIEEIRQMVISLKLKGSLRERKNGLLEFRNTIFGSVYGRTKEDFENQLNEKLRELKKNPKKFKKETAKAPLLSEFYKSAYLPYKKQELAESSILDIEISFAFIVDSGYDKPLNKYVASEIETFLLSIPQTRKRQKIRGVFNNIFSYAKLLGKIKYNPCENVSRVKHVNKVGRALSFQVQTEFFKNIFQDRTIPLPKKLYLVFIYLTGARRAEALAVQKSDFNLSENVLHIPGTKTDGSDRFIPLFPLVRSLYECMVSNGAIGKDTFFGVNVNQVSKLMEKGVEGYHLHELRHTFGTIAVCVQKLDPKTVSMYMGHTDITMTLSTYTHPEQLDRGLFFDGSLTESEKIAVMKEKYSNVLNILSDFLADRTQHRTQK